MEMSVITPSFYAHSIALLYLVFALAWLKDSQIHHELLKNPAHSQELHTHRLILIPSILMELFLIGMYWFPWHCLPFFLACYLTRTVQEFIDEKQWHTLRCSMKESTLHLIMWISVHAKTVLMFMWGFFYQFKGWDEMPTAFYLFFFFILLLNFIIAVREFKLKA